MKNKKETKLASPSAAGSVSKKLSPVLKKSNDETKGALSWVVVAGGVVIVYALYKIANNAGKGADAVGAAADAASSALDQLTNAINDPNLDASDSPLGSAGALEPTINQIQAQNKANALLEAMGSAGTDFYRVKQSLTGINVADYKLIADKFGTPRYTGLGLGPWPATKRNLSYWIVAELDNDELNQIRIMLPSLF